MIRCCVYRPRGPRSHDQEVLLLMRAMRGLDPLHLDGVRTIVRRAGGAARHGTARVYFVCGALRLSCDIAIGLRYASHMLCGRTHALRAGADQRRPAKGPSCLDIMIVCLRVLTV